MKEETEKKTLKEQLHKGVLLVVKIPPYYEKEYFYQITSAGEKLIRADLYHSPKVKKSWSLQELETLIDMGIIRFAREDERPQGTAEVQK